MASRAETLFLEGVINRGFPVVRTPDLGVPFDQITYSVNVEGVDYRIALVPVSEGDHRAQVFAAREVLTRWGQTDGAHHKAWVIDQVLRALCNGEEEYELVLKVYKQGEDGPETYEWDGGIAP